MNASAWCSAVSRPLSAVAARGVADRAVGIEVLRDPAESVLARRPQVRVVPLHLGGLRGKQLGLAHVDQVGPEMQHERGLDVAGVNAVSASKGE